MGEVCYSGQGDPEGKTEQEDLETRPEALDDSVEAEDSCGDSNCFGDPGESRLEEDDQEYCAVEAVGCVAREEGETRLTQLSSRSVTRATTTITC